MRAEQAQATRICADSAGPGWGDARRPRGPACARARATCRRRGRGMSRGRPRQCRAASRFC
eukprot:2075782-Alexandrium_andersonii.AAC.1